MAEDRKGLYPMVLSPEKYARTIGREAMRSNIMAAIIVSEILKTSLGPRGMDKMLVDELGDVTVTNDGATILDQMHVEHPAAKLIIEIAKTQDKEVGDGTKRSTVLAGELLKRADELLDKNVHPTILMEGYKKAELLAEKIVSNLAEKISIEDEGSLIKIAKSALSSKLASIYSDVLGKIIVDAVKRVTSVVDLGNGNKKIIVDLDSLKIEKKVGGGVEETELIEGIVIDKERIHGEMPKIVSKAKIALIGDAIEIKETETDARINISTPDQLEQFLNKEKEMLKKMVDKIKQIGANVVLVQKGVDDLAAYYFAKYGILAVRRVKKSDMEKLAKATGAKIINSIDELSQSDLGEAELVEERKVADENMLFVTGCKNPKAVTILIRAGSEHVADEIERSINDAVRDIATVIRYGKIIAGGGAIEMELSEAIRKEAKKESSKVQMAMLAFADALEAIPAALAENAGMDTIEAMTELRASHEQGKKWYGIDASEGKVTDMWAKNVIEPASITLQAIKSATEAAIMILKIDDVIAAVGKSTGAGSGAGSEPSEGLEE
ncbi:thermosome subunit alpha [Nanobdella aerobiophila]|uniref:Thermosome subunit alpha n=1 Tax=Nanobdella aerobiophila TaxID=2586965 RepID=A0A915WRC1_9ARCH|nr:thermosome subunit beta [Nanobdella aerobiophila]BBL45408.1 thermosome subunit alpha [Nanobdella aerobiophila]